VNNRLKELRKLRHWSQSELARNLGVSRQAVNGFESGKFDPSLEMAFKLARLFDVAIEDIFIDEGDKPMQALAERVKNFFGFDFGFERFTPQAINAINYARNEVAKLNRAQVEPEHLLVGLMAEETTTAARLLRANGATLTIEANENSFEPSDHIKLDAQSKFVLEMALQIVRLKGGRSIDTEHLLWGLMRLPEADAITLRELFRRYGIDFDALNQQLTEML